MLVTEKIEKLSDLEFKGNAVEGRFDANYKYFSASRIGKWDASKDSTYLRRLLTYTNINRLRSEVIEDMQRMLEVDGCVAIDQLTISAELSQIADELTRHRHPKFFGSARN